MSHPDPAAVPDTRPIEPGEVWENPVTLERAVIVEVPWLNDAGRAVADLTALPGARVVGEHLHPALHERFTVQDRGVVQALARERALGEPRPRQARRLGVERSAARGLEHAECAGEQFLRILALRGGDGDLDHVVGPAGQPAGGDLGRDRDRGSERTAAVARFDHRA